MSDLSDQQILQQLAAGELTADRAHELLQANKPKPKAIRYKVSNKGAISFYDLRRMPITLYVGELEKILSAVCADVSWSDEFSEFLENAGDSVSRK